MAIFTDNGYADALAVITALLVIFVAFFKWCFTFWKQKDVYTLPPSMPFGNAANIILLKEFTGSELKKVYDAFKQKGIKYGGYYIFGKPVFVPVDLDLVKHIMVKDFDYFTDHLMHVDLENQPLTGHLFALKGDAWKKLRQKIDPFFTPAKIKMMFETVVECTTELLPEVDRIMKIDECVDVKDLLSRFSIDIIGSCAFGIECNSLKNPKAEFAVYCLKFFTATLRNSIINFLSFFSPKILDYIKVCTIQKDVHDFFMNYVKENVKYRELHNIVRNDFLHLLIQLRNDQIGNNETPLTIEELAAQCFLLFLAGYEGLATTLTFCLYELAENPEQQEKVRKEIKTTLNKYGNKITYEAIMEMFFIEMCINETLRKHPPMTIHTRACTKRYKVPNSKLVLEKGTFIFIPTLGIHRDPRVYPDPEKFNPERFLTKNKANRHPSSFIPFGDGPRICLGVRFGMVAVKVGLISLLKNYRFTLNAKTKTPIVLDPMNPVVPNAVGGIWLDAEKLML